MAFLFWPWPFRAADRESLTGLEQESSGSGGLTALWPQMKIHSIGYTCTKGILFFLLPELLRLIFSPSTVIFAEYVPEGWGNAWQNFHISLMCDVLSQFYSVCEKE